MTFACLISLALYVYRVPLTNLFTEEDGLDVSFAIAAVPLFCLTNIFDMGLSFFMGVVRALGSQANIAIISIACYYFVSIPCAAYLAFVHETGIMGLWMGWFIGIIVQLVIIGWLTLRLDWQVMASLAQERLETDYDETISIVPDKFTNPSYFKFGKKAETEDSSDEERNYLLDTTSHDNHEQLDFNYDFEH